MKTDDINSIVLTVTTCLYFGGLLWLLSGEIMQILRSLGSFIRSKLKRISRPRKESSLDKSIRYLLSATFGEKSKITVTQYKTFTIVIFLFVFLNSFRFVNIVISVLLSAFMAAIPYLIIRLKLEKLRSLGSNEAEILISELLIKYKIKNFNMEEAIEEVMDSKGIVNTRQILSKLLIKLRSTRVDSELRDATRLFAYSIDTNWARMLASNIYQSSLSGINVSLSLEDILLQLREARKLKEERKRETAEPRRIFYSIPLIYAFLHIIGIKYMGVDVNHYLKNQFTTPQGLLLLGLSFAGFVVTFFFLSLLNNKKFDY